MIDIRKCHVCNRKFVFTESDGFIMTCRSCGDYHADVCRKCAKRIVLRDITETHTWAFETLPEPKFGGLILEAYSEVMPV